MVRGVLVFGGSAPTGSRYRCGTAMRARAYSRNNDAGSPLNLRMYIHMFSGVFPWLCATWRSGVGCANLLAVQQCGHRHSSLVVMLMELTMTVVRRHAPTAITVTGPLDATTGPDLETFLFHRFSRGDHDMVLNLRDITSMTPEGVTCLLTIERRFRLLGGSLHLEDANGDTLWLLGRSDALRPLRQPATSAARPPQLGIWTSRHRSA